MARAKPNRARLTGNNAATRRYHRALGAVVRNTTDRGQLRAVEIEG